MVTGVGMYLGVPTRVRPRGRDTRRLLTEPLREGCPGGLAVRRVP